MYRKLALQGCLAPKSPLPRRADSLAVDAAGVYSCYCSVALQNYIYSLLDHHVTGLWCELPAGLMLRSFNVRVVFGFYSEFFAYVFREENLVCMEY